MTHILRWGTLFCRLRLLADAVAYARYGSLQGAEKSGGGAIRWHLRPPATPRFIEIGAHVAVLNKGTSSAGHRVEFIVQLSLIGEQIRGCVRVVYVSTILHMQLCFGLFRPSLALVVSWAASSCDLRMWIAPALTATCVHSFF